MKRLKKGPELNLSKLRSGGLKPPAALTDLYRELKGQHLLPIVALLIIGLIAIPVLIGGSSHDQKAARVVHQPKIKGSSSKQTAFNVSKWTPGLLDYKKTLRGKGTTDPFSPKVSAPAEEGSGGEVEPAAEPAEIEVPTESTGGGGEAPSTPEGSGSSPEEGGSSNGGESSGEETGPITVDIQVTTVHQDGGVDRAPVRHDLPQSTKIPSEALPALTYVGPSEDGTKAMMAVSSEVTAMVGDSNCVVPAKPCSLLALKVAAPETIVYGKRGLTYRIELVRIGDHSNSPEKSNRNHPAPGNEVPGPGPAPREASSLIGVGGGRILDPASGF